ncbi:hypothetical protein SASPL_139582 [Salvia splendens]|uniref:Uncharacterized protein n=1 Tax=Salvia splendens TaxID=180675 RepID=A0A8X8WMB7_SALSN|nr:hypothetical protein SASPL_139582 [Salvia splendens]
MNPKNTKKQEITTAGIPPHGRHAPAFRPGEVGAVVAALRREREGAAAAVNGVVEQPIESVNSEGGVEEDVGLSDVGSVDGEIIGRVSGEEDGIGGEEGGEAGGDGEVAELGEGEALGDNVVGDEEGVEGGGGGGDGVVGGDEEGGGEG